MEELSVGLIFRDKSVGRDEEGASEEGEGGRSAMVAGVGEEEK